MTRKAIPLDALRCCRGVFWQNPFLRPDIPVSTGLITAKSLSTPRYPGIDGAYYGKILIYAPISRYRRGLLRQNPYLRPDVPVSTGLITAKSLSMPRCPGIDGAYYGKILICAPMSRYRRGLLRQNQSSPNLCVHSSSSYVSPSMLPLSSGDLIEWSLVCHSTLSYQKFCDRHSNHYDHPEELHQSVE